MLLLDTIRKMYPDQVEFLQWAPNTSFALDKLLGTNAYRTGEKTAMEIIEQSLEPVRSLGERVKRFFLYV